VNFSYLLFLQEQIKGIIIKFTFITIVIIGSTRLKHAPCTCKRSSPSCDFQLMGTCCRTIPYTLKGKFADGSAIHSFARSAATTVASDANVTPATEPGEGDATTHSALDYTAKVRMPWTCKTLCKDTGKGKGTGRGQAQAAPALCGLRTDANGRHLPDPPPRRQLAPIYARAHATLRAADPRAHQPPWASSPDRCRAAPVSPGDSGDAWEVCRPFHC
jgi:hypothetical protein